MELAAPLLYDLSVSQPEKQTPQLQTLNNALLRVARAVLLRNDASAPLADMPLAQIRCLNAVAKKEGRKMQDLANELDIKLPAMSQIVDRLVRRAMIERRADPRDRRVVRIHLTEEARQLLAQTQQVREQRLAQAVARLDTDIVDRLIDDLTQLAEVSETSDNNSPVSLVSLDGTDPMVEMLARRARVHRRSV